MNHSAPGPRRLVLALLLASALLPLAADTRARLASSWRSYLDAGALFEERRFGEAMVLCQRAKEERRLIGREAAAAIATASAQVEASRPGDSVDAVMRAFVQRDLTERRQLEIEAASGSSMLGRARLYAASEISPSFAAFLDAYLLLAAWKPSLAERDSLLALSAACRSLEEYPEAEAMLGRIYRAEGELRLAELQFQRSLQMGDSFEVADDRYAVLVSLAEIYRDQRRWREYEDRLLEVESADPIWQPKQDFLRAVMERTLLQEGFDRFMTLYRTKEGAATASSLELGAFYLERGRVASALTRLIVVSNSLMSGLLERLSADDPDYRYENFEGFLARIGRSPELRDYAVRAGLYRSLVVLGEALWFQGEGRERALYLWRGISKRVEAGEWAARAARNLASPPRPISGAP